MLVLQQTKMELSSGGKMLENGVKYIATTDVMYSRQASDGIRVYVRQ